MPDTMMGTLVDYLARSLVDDPDSVAISEHSDGDRITIRLDVAEDESRSGSMSRRTTGAR